MRRLLTPMLLLVAGLALLFDGMLIATIPIGQWDINEILANPYTRDSPPRGFSDIAHPLGLTAVHFGLRHLAAAGFPVRPVWTGTLVFVLAATAALLCRGARQLRVPWPGALALSAAYLLSPTILDLAGRAEENLLYHPLFVITLLSAQRIVAGSRRWGVTLLASGGCLGLALDHAQPSLVFCAAYAAAAIWRARPNRAGARALWDDLLIGLAVFGPAAAALITLRMLGLIRLVSYPTIYYSLLTQNNLAQYVAVFLVQLQQFLVTYRGFMIYRGPLDMTPQHPAEVALGTAVLLTLALWIALEKDFLRWPLLASLGLAILYEPVLAERWDTVLLSALALAAVGTNSGRVRRPALVLGLTCLAFVPVAFVTARQGLIAGQADLEQTATLIGDATTVYATAGGGRAVVTRLPRQVQLAPLERAPVNESILVALDEVAPYSDLERSLVQRRAAEFDPLRAHSLYRVTLRVPIDARREGDAAEERLSSG